MPLRSVIARIRLPRSLAGSVACAVAAALMTLGTPALRAAAQIIEKQVPADARGLDITEKLGSMLPLDTPLIRSDGKTVMLSDYFNGNDPKKPLTASNGKPTIIALVYYTCPVTCTAVMDKVLQCMNKLEYSVGTDYNTLFISFDPDETYKQAYQAKQMYLTAYDRPETPAVKAGFECFAAEAGASKAIADAIGFHYRRLENGQYSHPVAIFVATPSGRVSRYFYGFDYPPRDMKLSLIEAAEGKFSTSFGDRVLTFCYMYDPQKGRYTLQALRVMQVGGVITMLIVFSIIGVLLLAERARKGRKSRAGARAAQAPPRPQVVRVAALAPDNPPDPTHVSSSPGGRMPGTPGLT